MSIEKSELKALIANNLGADFEDRVEALQRQFHQQTGAVQALDQAGTKIPVQVSAKIKTILDEGGIKDGMTPQQVAEFAIKQVMRCGDFLRHLAEQEKKKQVILGGKVEGLKEAMQMVLKMKTDELDKADAAKAALESGEPLRGDARPSGVRPGPSQASQRKRRGNGKSEPTSASEAARKANGTLAQRRAAAKAEKGAKKKTRSKKKTARKKVTAKRKSSSAAATR